MCHDSGASFEPRFRMLWVPLLGSFRGGFKVATHGRDIRASDFFRHLAFVIRHSTTGSWSQCVRESGRGPFMNQEVGRVSPLRAVCASPSCGAHGVTRPTCSMSHARRTKSWGLSVNEVTAFAE